MNFFHIPRELIFARSQILKILQKQIFTIEIISNISREFTFANDEIFFFHFFDKRMIKSVRVEKEY